MSLLLLLPLAAAAQPTAFTYQGELSAGDAPADGSFDLRFGLFPAASGGTQIGADQTLPAVAVAGGVFTVQLDFGVSAFPGASRFLEIEVRPAGSGSFTTLTPRQQISSAPYAIRTLSAASADALSSACVGCVGDTQIQSISGAKISGAIPAASLPAGSGSYIQNGTTTQANARFNIAGNGTVGGVLSATAAALGGASVPNGVALAVNGPARVSPGGSGGYLQLGSPSGESGVSIVGANNRADLRFNDGTLKLVVGPGSGPPGATAGVSVNTAGQVGVGIDGALGGQLHVFGNQQPGIRAVSDGNRAIWGSSLGSSRGVFGDSVSGEGVHGESQSGTGVAGLSGTGGINNPGVFGASSGAGGVGVRGDGATGVYGSSASGSGVWGATSNPTAAAVLAVNSAGGTAIAADGNAKQSLAAGGWVKAMLYVESNGTISRCYNSQASDGQVSTPPCGFAVQYTGVYFITPPFDVHQRFISVTSTPSGTAQTIANVLVSTPRLFDVSLYTTDDDAAPAGFALFIY
ncbi:MAG: hypothetical protein SF182_03620 [Deltaproteobacteria bacterium]|nr:hypothetical protein [Deltaproteobacteria bacterium]